MIVYARNPRRKRNREEKRAEDLVRNIFCHQVCYRIKMFVTQRAITGEPVGSVGRLRRIAGTGSVC